MSAPAKSQVAFGFETECLRLPISGLLPVKALRPTVKISAKYQQIMASIREIGLVEPPVVSRSSAGMFLILDGHVRIEILKDLGQTEVECLVSTDDEAFTYNKRISRLSAVQEHSMIVRAIARGVPEEKIARALAINVPTIQRKARLLDGVCAEAASLLKDKQCPMALFEVLKKMKPMRQIETAELLNNANNYTVHYAAALLAGTPQSQLVNSDKPKKVKGITPEAMARMERELARLQEQLSSVQDSYGREHLQLTVIKGYLTKMLGNPRVVRYLLQHRPAFLSEFQAIAEANSTLPVGDEQQVL
jgi:ParB-like chromosome segregation protein Spo0J